MGIIKTVTTFFRGNTSRAEQSLKKTPAFWDGKLAENKAKVDKCIEAHRQALSKLNAKEEIRGNKEKAMKKWEDGSKAAYKKFTENQDVKQQILSKEAYFKYKELQAEVEILTEEIEVLRNAELELRKVKDNAATILNKARIEINKNKARAEFSDVVRSLTQDIGDVIDINIDGSECVAEEYFSQMSKVEDLGLQVGLNSLGEEDDYEKFVKGE
ncbi:MAG: hypothetical protein ACRCX7_10005 [Cetobacterium sp.]|uniref:hypothetical protein n=1 Tax=Cetobacterium sp. TaxID=2071632 RepID=UPI003F3473A6